MASGVRPPISSPLNRTEPPEGASAPEMQLKAVVLPEPFGPMSPRISPSRTSNDTRLSAVKSPKRLVRWMTLSTGRVAPGHGRAVPGRRTRRSAQRAANGEDAASGRIGFAVCTVLG